jgi:hypothetical protein
MNIEGPVLLRLVIEQLSKDIVEISRGTAAVGKQSSYKQTGRLMSPRLLALVYVSCDMCNNDHVRSVA